MDTNLTDVTGGEKKIIEVGGKIVDYVLASLDTKNKFGGHDFFTIQSETTSLRDEEKLYNFDQEYRELMDADEAGTLDEKGLERLKEIHKSNVIRKQLETIKIIYQKRKLNGDNPELVKAVENSFSKDVLKRLNTQHINLLPNKLSEQINKIKHLIKSI